MFGSILWPQLTAYTSDVRCAETCAQRFTINHNFLQLKLERQVPLKEGTPCDNVSLDRLVVV